MSVTELHVFRLLNKGRQQSFVSSATIKSDGCSACCFPAVPAENVLCKVHARVRLLPRPTNEQTRPPPTRAAGIHARR